MEQLQAPRSAHLRQERPPGGLAPGAGAVPRAAEAAWVRDAHPWSTGGCGTEAGADGRTVSKSREPRAESREYTRRGAPCPG